MASILQTPGVAPWAARGAAVFCLLFAGLQVAVALGAPFGHFTWGGAASVLPPTLRAASAGAAVYLVVAAAAMLVRAGDWGRRLPPALFRGVAMVLALQMLLNTAGNLFSKSDGERTIMGAASLIGFLLCAAAAAFTTEPKGG
jgi:hypothetical protein